MATDQQENKGPDARRWAPLGLVALGIGVAIAVVVVAWQRTTPLTELELILFQVISLGLGLGGSYAFGVRAASSPPNARSAFRRVLSLYEAFGRLSATIDERRTVLEQRAGSTNNVPLDAVHDSLEVISTQVTENLRTIDDAMEDWRDLAPTEVERIQQQANERRKSREVQQ